MNQAMWRHVWDEKGALCLGKAPVIQSHKIRECEVISLPCSKLRYFLHVELIYNRVAILLFLQQINLL